MKLLTFNIQNKYYIKNYNGIYKNKDTTRLLARFIKNTNIDVLCTQEMVINYQKNFLSKLNNYQVYGNYRIKNRFFRRFKLLNKFNESVNIFTNLKVIISDTIFFPSNFFNAIKRIFTYIIIDDPSKIMIINTHLTAYKRNQKIRLNQVKYLLNFIHRVNIPVIIMGDFNMNIKNPIFKYFINELEKIDIIHLNINERTLKISKNNLAIDHVFVSNNLKIKKIQIIKNDLVNFSDHYPILLEI